MKIDFYKYGIDHIFCINYIKNNRKQRICEEFDYIGLDYNNGSKFSWEYDIDDNLFPLEQLYNLNNVYFRQMSDLLGLTGNKLSFNTYKLSLRLYKIFKTSLDLGYNKILVFEDDIRFLKNKNNIQKHLDNLDWNSDLMILNPDYSFISNTEYNEFYNEYNEYLICKQNGLTSIYSSSTNVYSKKYMQLFIILFEKLCIFSPDHYYFLKYIDGDIKTLITKYPICCQEHHTDKTFEIINIKRSQFRD